MNRKTPEINKICSETLEGHQRAIMGTMTVEDIYKNRAAFSEQVLEVLILQNNQLNLIICLDI